MCRESTKQHQDIVSLQSPRRNIFHLLTGMLTSYSSEGVSCVNSFNFLARTKIGFVWNVIGCLWEIRDCSFERSHVISGVHFNSEWYVLLHLTHLPLFLDMISSLHSRLLLKYSCFGLRTCRLTNTRPTMLETTPIKVFGCQLRIGRYQGLGKTCLLPTMYFIPHWYALPSTLMHW